MSVSFQLSDEQCALRDLARDFAKSEIRPVAAHHDVTGEYPWEVLKKAHARLERWREWVEPEPADPSAGMPLAAALAVCDRTVAWAGARHAIDGDELYSATLALASDVRAALIKLGREALQRTLVERIVDQALDIGHDNPASAAEAALPPRRTGARAGRP